MLKDYEVVRQSGKTTLYSFTDRNAKGEKIQFELTPCSNPGGKNSLPYLWKKHGFIDRVLETWWSLQVYVTDKEGCWGCYNPTEKLSDDGTRKVINFDWMLEATEENKQKLIDEVFRLANA